MTAAPVALLRTSDVLVTEEAGCIRFRPVGTVLFGLGIGSVVVAFVLWMLAGVGFERSHEGFTTWGSWVLVVCGVILTLQGVARHFAPPWLLDARRRVLSRGRRSVAFEDLADVCVTSTTVGSTTAIALRVETSTGPIWLVTGQMAKWREDVERLAARIKLHLGDPATASLAVVASARPLSATDSSCIRRWRPCPGFGSRFQAAS